MEHDLVVEGKVVLRDSVEDAQVGISDGLIAEVRKTGLKGARRIGSEGSLVFPGFVDSHVHLREPGWEHKEDFRTGTRAAAHGGVTTVIDMPNNPRPTVSTTALIEKAELAAAKGVVDVRLFAGLVGSNLGEIGSMSKRAVGFKGYMGVSTGGLLLSPDELREALPLVAKTGRPVSLHCEDQGIIDERSRALAGSSAPDAYCDMRPPESEVASVAAATAIAEKSGARVNVCHVSTAGSVAAVRSSSLKGAQVRCEVALHHLFFNRKAMASNPLLRMNPPLRGEDDRAEMVRALSDGRIASLVTDHAPHTRKEKVEQGAAGVTGLDDFGHVVAWLVKSCGIDPATIGRTASSGPSAYYGLTDRGEVSVGRRADLAVLDFRSERSSPDSLETKCGWSPYEGLRFPGRVSYTVSSGRLIVDDGLVC